MRRLWVIRAVLLLCVLFIIVSVTRMVSMPGTQYSGGAVAADEALANALRADVTHLAVDIGERNLGNEPEALQRTAAWLETRLTSLGYDVRSQSFQVGDHEVRNLSVERRGVDVPDELVVVGAHYDSMLGTPGADDNGSGVSVALSLAEFFSKERPRRTIRFVFFTNEEPPFFRGGLMGSDVAAKASRSANENITAMLSLETLGYYRDEERSQHYPWLFSLFYPTRGDFVAFVGDTASRELVHDVVLTFRGVAKIKSDGVAAPSILPGIDWSDQGPYWRQGYPGLMVTDTAPFRNPNYHREGDLPDTLDYARLAHVTVGLRTVVTRLANATP